MHWITLARPEWKSESSGRKLHSDMFTKRCHLGRYRQNSFNLANFRLVEFLICPLFSTRAMHCLKSSWVWFDFSRQNILFRLIAPNSEDKKYVLEQMAKQHNELTHCLLFSFLFVATINYVIVYFADGRYNLDWWFYCLWILVPKPKWAQSQRMKVYANRAGRCCDIWRSHEWCRKLLHIDFA